MAGANDFDDFCRFAFGFLESRNTRYLVVGGLAVVAVGEPRTTADVRRHGRRLDVAYLERTLLPICELAEDMAAWSRLQRVLAERRPAGT